MSIKQQRLMQQLSKAVALIEESFIKQSTTPSLNELAAAAALSPFHFHRIYRLMLGETCQQTITRLQVAKAANSLKTLTHSVTEISLQSGFSSSQAMAKIFKRELSITASDLRSDPEQLSAILTQLAHPASVHNNSESTQTAQIPKSAFEVRLVSLSPLQLVAVATENRYPELNELYWQLFELAEGPDHVAAIIGVAYGDIESAAAAQSRFDCALLLSKHPAQLPEPFLQRDLPAQHCCVLRHQGSYQHLADTIDMLYATVLNDNRYLPTHQPCLLHYLDDPEQTSEALLRTDIYLPVQSV